VNIEAFECAAVVLSAVALVAAAYTFLVFIESLFDDGQLKP